MMRRCVLAVLALGLTGLSLPGVAAAGERCQARPGEHAAARSARATLLLERLRAGTPRETQRLTGCSRRTGRRRTLLESPIDSLVPLFGVVSLRLNGTRVVTLSQAGDHLGAVWISFSRAEASDGAR